MNLGDNIKELRKKKKITQNEFAKKINKSESTVQKYESGSVTPDIKTLNKIAGILEVPFNELIEYQQKLFSFRLFLAIEKVIIESDEYRGRPAIKYIEYRLTQLDIDVEPFYTLVKYRVAELSLETQLILLQYLFELDYDSFFNFCQSNEDHIGSNSILKTFVNKCYADKIDNLKTTSYLAFKNYLCLTFGDKIKYLKDDDLLILNRDAEKFLEFALYKLEKEYQSEENNEGD